MTPTEPQTGDWIALYGSLMRGLGAMDELGIGAGLRFVGPCIVQGALFDLGAHPGLRHGDGRVVSELYAILDASVIVALDEFEGFYARRPRDSLYLRESILLAEPEGTRAWIYVYNRVPDASERIMPADWRAHLAERGLASGGSER